MNIIGFQPGNSKPLGAPGASMARYLAALRFGPRIGFPEPCRPSLDLVPRRIAELALPPAPSPAQRKLPPLTEGKFVRIYTDRITKAARQAIATGGRAQLPDPAFQWGFSLTELGATDSLTGVVGLPWECDPDLPTVLETNPALVMQTELILSARVFQQCGFEVGPLAQLSAAGILDDRGIKRRQSGEHKPERLEEQLRAIRFLVNLRVAASYAPQGREKPALLNGAVWKVSEDDQAALGSPRYRSAAFTVGRGSPFFNMAWALQNEFAKPVGAGLLTLSRQKAGALLGAYLATVAPMHKFAPKVFDVETLFAEAGLAGSDLNNPKRRREGLEAALDGLRAAGVIGTWKPEDAGHVRISWPKGIKAVPDRKARKGRGRA